jgi:hypothetical protein
MTKPSLQSAPKSQQKEQSANSGRYFSDPEKRKQALKTLYNRGVIVARAQLMLDQLRAARQGVPFTLQATGLIEEGRIRSALKLLIDDSEEDLTLITSLLADLESELARHQHLAMVQILQDLAALVLSHRSALIQAQARSHSQSSRH